MRPELVQIDAFTDRPFSGNPAGICLLDREPDVEWMQAVAREMNLSETAYLVAGPVAPDLDGWSLRWFTPEVEVDLCGHATLAAAHFLYEHRRVDEPLLHFGTRSGILTARRTPDGWIELDFPADQPQPAAPPDGLLDALGVGQDAVSVAQGRTFYVVELPSADQVRALVPDMGALSEVEAQGFIVTSVGDGLYDIVSRFFAPAMGIPEDPVTGAAHCTLAPYWAARLGKDDLLAHQASPRGGVMRVGLRGDRVLLGGQAVSVFKLRFDDTALPPRRRSRARADAASVSR